MMTKKGKIESGALIVLAVTAAGIWYRYDFQPAGSARVSSGVVSYKPIGVESLGLHTDRRVAARGTEYKTTGRNIFLAQAPPAASTVAQQREEEKRDYRVREPIDPPAELPGNLKYFGYGTVPVGSGRRAFLTDGDEVYVVAEGDTLLGRYKILRISNANLEFEEISTHRRGSKTLEEQQGPSV